VRRLGDAMGCSSSKAADRDVATLARRSVDNGAQWFDVSQPAPSSQSAAPAPAAAVPAPVKAAAAPAAAAPAPSVKAAAPSSAASKKLSEEERSLLRTTTILELRVLLDTTGGVFTADTIADTDVARFAQSITLLAPRDVIQHWYEKGVSPRDAIQHWYDVEARTSAALAETGPTESSDPSSPVDGKEATEPRLTAAAATAPTPAEANRRATAEEEAAEAAAEAERARAEAAAAAEAERARAAAEAAAEAERKGPGGEWERAEAAAAAAKAAAHRRSEAEREERANAEAAAAERASTERPVELVAQEAMATLHKLVAATGGEFTDETIPPRLLARLSADVTRVREELENRRPEKFASGSTAGKRRAIENWYHEQQRKAPMARI